MRPSPIVEGTIGELEALLDRQGTPEKRLLYIKAAGFTNNQTLLNSLTDDADKLAWHEGKDGRP